MRKESLVSSANGLVVTGTIFSHREIYKLTLTCRSADGSTVNWMDHACYGEL